MSHQINKDAIREAIGIDEDYYVAIWRADGNKDKQLNKIILSNLIENLNTKNYANYDLTFTGNRIHNVANYTITHNNSASYAYNLIAASAYSVGITTTTAAFRVSDGGMTIGSKSTVPTKVLDVVGDARIRTVSNDNALTNLLAIDANGNVFYRTSSSLAPSSAALTKTDDTNVTLTLGGSPSTALLAAASITVGWTGTLADSRIASASTWNAKIGGSGTTNYISKFTASGTIGNSLIQDDGSNISINNSLQSLYKVYINSDKLVGLGVFNNAASGTNNFGISGSATNANSASNVGVFGNALLSSGGTNLGVRGQSASQTVTDSTSIISAGSNVGGFFQANASSATSYGLVSSADALSNQPSATFIGALLRANNAGTRYAAQLIDGTEGSGKFFKSVTSSGHGNWASLAATDITSGLGSALQYLRVNAGGTALEYATLSTSNLGNSDLTSTANSRYFYLNGSTSSNFLKFRNSDSISILSLLGDKSVIFGNVANPVTMQFNIDAADATGDLWYRNVSGNLQRLAIGSSSQVLTVAGGLPSWATVSAPNLATANLTSNAAVRSYTLAGTASTDYLDFLSGGGSPSSFFRLQGDKIITFGNSVAPIKRNLYYMSSASSSEFVYYRDNSQFLSIDANNRQIYLSGGTGQILMSGTTGIFSTYGDSATMLNFKANGDLRGAWGLEYGHGSAFLSTSAGARNIYMNANGWCAFNRNTSIGIDYNTNPSARLQVAGSGATSATTTALFQNSSSVNTLSLRDDGVVQLGVNGTTGIRFDPYGRTSFAMLQYLAAASSYASLIYDSLNQQIFSIQSNGAVSSSRPSGGTSTLNYNNTINFQAEAVGDNFAYTSRNSLGNYTMYLRNQGNVGTFELMNSAGVNQLYLAGANGSYILNNLAIGKNTAATSGVMLEVVGVINAPQITNTPATITVAANAGTVTRANRINKFTNSSAATMTITMSTTAALDGDLVQVRIYDFSAATQTITWVNTENSSITVPATSNGSTTLPLTVGFQYNSATSKWRCIGSV